MSMSSIPSPSPTGKLYGWVEKIGNKVPHPFLLFIYLIVILMVATAVLSAFDVSVRSPADGSLVAVKNLLSVDGLHWFLPNVIKNFSGFAPLGAILALVLGAGLAERVGLLPALMVKMASHVSARYASYMVLFIAFFSHISSDAALVIMPPMGALIFLAVGRHPVAGLLSAIAGVGCRFTANLLIVTTDVLLSGISTEAAKTIDTAMHVSVIDNWYFMASSVIVLTIVGGLITDKIIEPRLGKWEGRSDEKLETLSKEQRFGLRVAGVVSLAFIALVALMVVPENSILVRSPSDSSPCSASVCLSTTVDSPVRMASSTRRLCASIRRISAGIRSPARSTTISPGTSSVVATVMWLPSRITCASLESILRMLFSDFSALLS